MKPGAGFVGFVKNFRFTIIILLVILFLGFVGKTYYDTNSIEIRHYNIQKSSLGEVLAGLKVAHLSDLHMKQIGIGENKIVEILKEEKPDLIFITGDLIKFKSSYEPVVSFLSRLNAPLGVYAVLGNTEYSNENGSCILCHQERSKELKKDKGIIFLRNSFVSLKINRRILNIPGVDDPVKKKSDLVRTTKGMSPNHPSILLAHSPEIFAETSQRGIDFLLCGHTHGGQIFLTRYLKNVFPLMDPAYEFLDGFFQEGNTLMYVNRGIGTSFLPFRFGVKPEIAFFTFSNKTDTEKSNNFIISDSLTKTLFAGLKIADLRETFNIFNFSNLRSSSKSKKYSPVFFDFETEEDLKRLNWECHKWFELSIKHATSGKNSLRVILPPGQYPGIEFEGIPSDWSKSSNFKMDIFNPEEENIKFHIRIDDSGSGWEYADRFDFNVNLQPGMNNISIPLVSIKTNIHSRPLDLKTIERLMVFIPRNAKKREIYIDNIRLE